MLRKKDWLCTYCGEPTRNPDKICVVCGTDETIVKGLADNKIVNR